MSALLVKARIFINRLTYLFGGRSVERPARRRQGEKGLICDGDS